MRTKSYIVLVLFGLMLFSPVISFTIRAAFAQDSTNLQAQPDSSISDSMLDQPTRRDKTPLVYKMEIDGAIGTVTSQRLEEAVEQAEEDQAELLVVFLDTPGGFSNATHDICKTFLNSYVPVCLYVAPSGARAGSAGVYMTYAAHFAAMAPSTNIGAAHPVSGDGQEIDSVMNEKITNDAVAQMKAYAEKRGRNVEWAEKSVRESVSITDNEALSLNVINYRAANLDELIEKIDGDETEIPSGTKTMSLKRYEVREIKSTFVHRVLEVITDPNVAFLLMSIGGLGIILELYNPGSILPGVVGVISLILAFYAFQTLPINYAGLALIILSVVLFIAEVKVVSHGILTLGGVVSFFFGGLMLIDTVDPELQISKSVLITVVVCIGLIVGIVSYLVIKASRHQPYTGDKGMMGKIAEVRTNNMVYVDGALWKAVSDTELIKGDKVEVVGVDKLTLKVKKVNS